MDPKDNVIKIEEILNSVAEGNLRANKSMTEKDWTREILLQIGRLAKSGDQKYEVCAIGSPEFEHSEFLFDMCWLEYGPDREFLRRAALILESEWGGQQDIYHDFEKLLLGRAILKVMIFSAKSATEMEATYSQLDTYVERFEDGDPSETYLLACFLGAENRFEFRQRCAPTKA